MENLGRTGVNVRCHYLPEVEPNHTNLSPDITNTVRVGNAKVETKSGNPEYGRIKTIKI